MIETLLLWAFGGIALVAALSMLALRAPMHVAVALVVTMLSLAGVYGLVNAHAIAIFQVLIYVGAVMVFMVYAIMLLDVRDRAYTRRYSVWLVPGAAGLLVLVVVLTRAIWRDLPEAPLAAQSYPLQPFAELFLNDYWLHFELVSLLLVAAVVGALAVIEIGRRRRG